MISDCLGRRGISINCMFIDIKRAIVHSCGCLFVVTEQFNAVYAYCVDFFLQICGQRQRDIAVGLMQIQLII